MAKSLKSPRRGSSRATKAAAKAAIGRIATTTRPHLIKNRHALNKSPSVRSANRKRSRFRSLRLKGVRALRSMPLAEREKRAAKLAMEYKKRIADDGKRGRLRGWSATYNGFSTGKRNVTPPTATIPDIDVQQVKDDAVEAYKRMLRQRAQLRRTTASGVLDLNRGQLDQFKRHFLSVAASPTPDGNPSLSSVASWMTRTFRPFRAYTEANASSTVLHALGFFYGPSNSVKGYYFMRANDPTTLYHRSLLLPLLKYVNDNDGVLFDAWYGDESAFRQFPLVQNNKWQHKDDPRTGYDFGGHTNVGDGWDVCCFINRRLGVLRTSTGEFCGYARSTKDKPGRATSKGDDASSFGSFITEAKHERTLKKSSALASSKEDGETFVALIDHASATAKAVHGKTGRIQVVFVDGARIHTTYGADFVNPGRCNLDKANDEQPTTLKQLLKKHGQWVDGLDRATAVDIAWLIEAILNQPLAAEAAVHANGCVILFLANGHPQLNSEEKLWRAMKTDVLQLPTDQRSLANIRKAIEKWLDQSTSSAQLSAPSSQPAKGCTKQSHIDKWYMTQDLYMRYAQLSGDAEWPTEYNVLHQLKATLEEVEIDTSAVSAHLENNGAVDLEKLKALAHGMNMYRKRATTACLFPQPRYGGLLGSPDNVVKIELNARAVARAKKAQSQDGDATSQQSRKKATTTSSSAPTRTSARAKRADYAALEAGADLPDDE